MIIAGNGYSAISKFVFDGDTLSLDCKGDKFTARLQWIDTPEAKKPTETSIDPTFQTHWIWAARAKTALLNLVDKQNLIVIPSEKDQYDRWVCDLYIGKVSAATNVQIQLCKAGMATSYLPFNRHSYSSRELTLLRGIITETANANRKKVGIWSEPNFILPYEFKKLIF